MKVLAFAIAIGCLAVAHAFFDGPTPTCNQDNVDAGTFLMPHERYCQLYYSCNQDLVASPLFCYPGFLFSYTTGLANCLPAGHDDIVCPNWNCDRTINTIGNRYPDLCCSTYWECTASGIVQLPCGAGLEFDALTELCVPSVGSTCNDNQFCSELILPSADTNCHNFPSPSGNPCTFQTVYGGVTTLDRRCPDGAAFDPDTCTCSLFNNACNNQYITYDEALINKQFDANCRASRIVDFTTIPPRTTSAKLNLELRHWFLVNSVGSNGQNEAVFLNAGNGNFLYDYFFNDNELFAPFAMRMTFRLDNLFAANQEAILLSNEFSLDPNNPLCNPATFLITIRFDGLSAGLQSYTISLNLQGVNGNFATASGTILGNTDDYYTFTLVYAGTVTMNVYNRGIFGTGPFQSPTAITSGADLGGKLRPNKCGFVIGRNFAGVIREYITYEGCGNFQNILI